MSEWNVKTGRARWISRFCRFAVFVCWHGWFLECGSSVPGESDGRFVNDSVKGVEWKKKRALSTGGKHPGPMNNAVLSCLSGKHLVSSAISRWLF